MKKAVGVVVGVVVLVVGGWTAASWYTGKRVEQEIRLYINELNEQAGLGAFSVENYERGIFSSSASYRFVAGTMPMPLNLVRTGDEILFEGDIQHGPWPWRQLRKGALMPVLAATHTRLQNVGAAQLWFAAASGQTPLEEQSVIRYNGTVDFSARFASLKLEGPEFSLQADGGAAHGTIAEDGQVLDIEGRFGDVQLHVRSHGEYGNPPPAELLLKGTSLTANSQKGRFDIHPGAVRLAIDQIRLDTLDEQGQPLQVLLDDYLITGNLGEDETHIHGNVGYQVGQLQVAGVSLGGLGLNFTFGHLEGATVQHLMQRYQQLLPQIMEESAQAGPHNSVLSPVLETWLEESMAALLPGNPTFGIDDLRWSLDGKESRLAVQLALQPPGSAAPHPLLDTVARLNAELVLSRPMVIELLTRLEQLPGGVIYASPEQARESAQATFEFVQRLALVAGYATLEGDNLTSRLSYANGAAQLNGREIPLADLLGQMGH